MQSPNTGTMKRQSAVSERMKETDKINDIVSGKNVLITGGATGLGFAFVNHFLQHGASKIAILDNDQDGGKRATIAIEKSYGKGKVIFIHTDVSQSEKMIEAFKEASQMIGRIGIVINNAGVLDERRWEREIAVNIGGMLSCAMLAMEYMGKDKGGQGGTLINVAQYLDFTSTAQLPIYSATKHAIIGLSQSLAAPFHLDKTGVRVLTLCPGLTDTGLMVESPNKLLSRVMKADFVKNLEQQSIQTPFIVARGLMIVLRIGEPGSIWVVEGGKAPYEVYVPERHSLRRYYKNNDTFVEPVKVTRGRPIRDACDNTQSGLTSCA